MELIIGDNNDSSSDDEAEKELARKINLQALKNRKALKNLEDEEGPDSNFKGIKIEKLESANLIN